MYTVPALIDEAHSRHAEAMFVDLTASRSIQVSGARVVTLDDLQGMSLANEARQLSQFPHLHALLGEELGIFLDWYGRHQQRAAVVI